MRTEKDKQRFWSLSFSLKGNAGGAGEGCWGGFLPSLRRAGHPGGVLEAGGGAGGEGEEEEGGGGEGGC